MFSNKLKQYFIKDFKLPVPLLEEKYWNYYLETLDPYYNSIQSYGYLTDMLSELKKQNTNIEEAFFKENKKLINNVIDSIKDTE